MARITNGFKVRRGLVFSSSKDCAISVNATLDTLTGSPVGVTVKFLDGSTAQAKGEMRLSMSPVDAQAVADAIYRELSKFASQPWIETLAKA